MNKKHEYVYVLRTCNSNMRSYGGFKWPLRGAVEAPDWKRTYECGHGLHGLLWGSGDGKLLDWSADARWIVVRVLASDCLSGRGDLLDKCKFRRGTVVHVGDRMSAISYMERVCPPGTPIVGSVVVDLSERGTATAGYRGTATAGYRGTATAGDNGTATAGYRGTATAGDNGTATAGDNGTATAGYRGTATAGYRGTATAGYRGTATAGYRGTATAGDNGTATVGDHGTAIAGACGIATASLGGIVSAGIFGTVSCRYISGNTVRCLTAKVDGKNILPGIRYRVINGKFTKAS